MKILKNILSELKTVIHSSESTKMAQDLRDIYGEEFSVVDLTNYYYQIKYRKKFDSTGWMGSALPAISFFIEVFETPPAQTIAQWIKKTLLPLQKVIESEPGLEVTVSQKTQAITVHNHIGLKLVRHVTTFDSSESDKEFQYQTYALHSYLFQKDNRIYAFSFRSSWFDSEEKDVSSLYQLDIILNTLRFVDHVQ